MKLQQQYLYYLQHKVKFVLTKHADSFEGLDFYKKSLFKKGAIWELSGYADPELMIPMGDGEINGFIFNNGSTYINMTVEKLGILPILKPLDDIKESLSDWLWISEPEWFDDKENALNWLDIMFVSPLELPFNVFNKVLSLHGDVFEAIDKGLAVDYKTLPQPK